MFESLIFFINYSVSMSYVIQNAFLSRVCRFFPYLAPFDVLRICGSQPNGMEITYAFFSFIEKNVFGLLFYIILCIVRWIERRWHKREIDKINE